MQTVAALADIWFAILALLLYLYIVTDGFDLGVGILVLFQGDENLRGRMAHSIEGVWHANQTWLVIAGGVLFGAFPMVYGSVLSALYLPLALLLFSMICRGVALEYRPHARNKRQASLWFGVGSLLTAFAQGLLLGGVLQGIPLENGEFTGSLFAWLQPFPILLGLLVCAAYVVLGGCWLAIKTDGELQRQAMERAKLGVMATGLLLTLVLALQLVGLGAEHLGAGLLHPLPLALVALAVVLLGLVIAGLNEDTAGRAFALTAGAVLAVMLAFTAAIYPHIVPPSLTLAEAASPENMLRIMLYVIGAFLPVLLYYNLYQYRVFRGKVEDEDEDA